MDKAILEQDGVTVNAETDINSFPVEPLNTVSNIFFLFILIYWIRKVGFKYYRYPLIVIILPMIFLGLTSSTIHHSLRIHKAWNTVTLLPIFYSVVMTCVYLWYRISKKWLYSFFLTMLFPLVFWMFYLNVEMMEKINLSMIFAAMSVAILIPALLLCLKNNLKNLELLGLSSFLFFIGMIFRMGDLQFATYFSHGSHFLWHVFGSASVFVLLRFIYLADEQRARELNLKVKSRRKKRRIITSLFKSESKDESESESESEE